MKGRISLLQVDREISSFLRRRLPSEMALEETRDPDGLLLRLQQGMTDPDVAVFGLQLQEPATFAQRFYFLNRKVSILILSRPEHYKELKHALRFSPFLGSDVHPWSTSEIDSLPGALEDAVTRTRRQKSYASTINAVQSRLTEAIAPKTKWSHYLDRLLDYAPIGIVNVDSKMVIKTINRQAGLILNMSESEALGTPFDRFLSESEKERFSSLLAPKPILAREPVSKTIKMSDMSGRSRFVEVTAAPFAEHSGDLSSLVLLQDIHERVQAESQRRIAEDALRESEERYQQLYDSAPDMFASVDPGTAQIMKCNRTLQTNLGYRKKEIIGRSVFDLYHPDSMPEACKALESFAATGEVHNAELQLRRKDGSKIDVILNASAVRDENGKILYSSSSWRDITARKRGQKEREQLLGLLKKKNKELQEVVYVISHDLRSPLVNLHGFSEELSVSCAELRAALKRGSIPPDLSKEVNPIIEDEIPEALHVIRTSVSKMDSLLQGLVKLSHLGNAAARIQRLNIDELLSSVIKTFEFQIKKGEIKVDLGKLSPCYGDELQIGQVFSNLIGNAIKYLDPHRPGRIKVTGTKKKNQCIYCIRDNGVGIPEADQEQIFKIFHRLRPHDTEGQGLGLTIVHRIVERHNGRIWLESEPGKGCSFFVSLPAEPFELLTTADN